MEVKMELCELWQKILEATDDVMVAGLDEASRQSLCQHLSDCESCASLIGNMIALKEERNLVNSEKMPPWLHMLVTETEIYSPEEMEAMEGMCMAIEEDECRIRNMVSTFIAAYPELAPEKYGLPKVADPADPILYYFAWSAVKCLAKRLARYCVNETVERFAIGEDGSLLMQGTLKSDPEAQGVINDMHLTTNTGVVRLDPQYVQSEIRFMSDGEIGPEDAQRMALWLRDALKLHPKLSVVNGKELDKWKVDNENKPH